jgi:hypothetical protein
MCNMYKNSCRPHHVESRVSTPFVAQLPNSQFVYKTFYTILLILNFYAIDLIDISVRTAMVSTFHNSSDQIAGHNTILVYRLFVL